MFSFVPKNERIVVAEETPELFFPHEHVIKLNCVEELGFNMKDLIIESLRIRPDKIVVGEIRKKDEVFAFIDTLLAGQAKGSYATFHSQSALEAIERFKSFKVLEQDICSLDLILVQKRWTKKIIKLGKRFEVRRVIEVSEVLNNDGKAVLNKLFEFDFLNDCLIEKNESKKLLEKIKQSFGFSKKQVLKELKLRQKILESPQLKEKNIFEFLNFVESFETSNTFRKKVIEWAN
jgi:Tfp pilus assembly ATPase PilU